jgi:radical SAM-linked protein
MRFTGHLDLHRTWERTFRRAKLPLAYSQGFHPQPRINLAAALPLGFTSQAEIADFWLETDLTLPVILSALIKTLPPGLIIDHIEEIDPKAPSLQTQVRSSEYIITLLESIPELDERLVKFLTTNNLPRERRGRKYDLRPLVEELDRLPDDECNQACLHMRLSTRPGKTGRPEEVLDVLGIPFTNTLIQRIKLIF